MQVCRESMDYLVDQIRAIEPKLEAYQQLGLPMQLIHGDLHYDNVRVLGDTVSGLLDFEVSASIPLEQPITVMFEFHVLRVEQEAAVVG